VDEYVFLLVRSARRTMGLEIQPNATIVVRAPRRAALRQIYHFVESHNDWIERKLAQVLARSKPKPKEFVHDEEFLFLGQTCRLYLTDASAPSVSFDGRLLLSKTSLLQARGVILDWYKNQARNVIGERVDVHATMMRCQPTGIRITSPRRRWASCGAAGGLNFNWRIVMGPLEVIDYIVVHELAHLKHRGHGRDFWDFVANFFPSYRISRQWLKDNGHLLDI